jgi:hypothetical protein
MCLPSLLRSALLIQSALGCAVLLSIAAAPAGAEEKPLWEHGLGGPGRSTDRRLRLDLRLLARAVFTVEAVPRLVGTFLAPNLRLDIAQHPEPGSCGAPRG